MQVDGTTDAAQPKAVSSASIENNTEYALGQPARQHKKVTDNQRSLALFELSNNK